MRETDVKFLRRVAEYFRGGFQYCKEDWFGKLKEIADKVEELDKREIWNPIGDDPEKHGGFSVPQEIVEPLISVMKEGKTIYGAPIDMKKLVSSVKVLDYLISNPKQLMAELKMNEMCPQDHHLKDGKCRYWYCSCSCERCKKQCEEGGR